MRRFTLLIAAFAIGLASSALAAQPLPRVPMCGGAPQVRPSAIVLECAVSKTQLTNITWSSWTQTGAQGLGTLRIPQMDKWVTTPAIIQLSRVRGGLFTRESTWTIFWRVTPA